LVVLWAATGVSPRDVWKETDRRESLFGIAEKLHKDHKARRKLATSSLRRAQEPQKGVSNSGRGTVAPHQCGNKFILSVVNLH
jgi:hypothetical protein